MSLLYRNGTDRNNIAWGGSTTIILNYLQRTSSSRNNIRWYTIPQSNATYNLLNRTSTGRNDIVWKNTTFTFGGDLTKVDYTYIRFSGQGTSWEGIAYFSGNNVDGISISNVTKNTFERSGTLGSLTALGRPYNYCIGVICSDQNDANIAAQELSKFSKVTYSGPYSSQTINITGNHKTQFYQHRPNNSLYWEDVYLGIAELDGAFTNSNGANLFTFS